MILRGKKFGRPVSAVSFDLNAVEMRTAEHCIYLTKFCELACMPMHELQFWRIEYDFGNIHVCLIRDLKQDDDDAFSTTYCSFN